MPKYRKKPVVVDAEQWFIGKRLPGVKLSTDRDAPTNVDDEHGHRLPFSGREVSPIAVVKTIHGNRILRDGEWVIREMDGVHYYPCKPDIFDATYDLA